MSYEYSIRKVLLYISGTLILISTIGISLLTIHDRGINKKYSKKNELNLDWEDLRYDFDRSLSEYNRSMMQKNHIDILRLLNENSNDIKQAKERYINIMKHSIYAIHHAVTRKEERQITLENLDDLNTYEELWPIYYKYIQLGMEKHDRLVKERKAVEEKVKRMEGLRGIAYVILIILNSVGLFLGILSYKYEN